MNFTEGVSVVVMRPDGKIAVNKRIEPGQAFEGYYQFPGGKCEPNENPCATARRELREEAGILIPFTRFVYLRSDKRPHNKKPDVMIEFHGFYVELEDGEELINTEPDKQTDWEFMFPVDVLRLKLIPGLQLYVVNLPNPLVHV